MNCEWWDTFFNGMYSSFQKTLKLLILVSTLLRILTGFSITFEVAFKSPQLELLFVKLLLLLILEILENKPIIMKKFALYSVLEVLNFFYKYLSVYVYQGEVIMLCMVSTIFTALFQSSIFQNSYHIGFIVIKHTILWYYFDDRFERQNFNHLLSSILIVALIFICTLYEEGKRSQLQRNYYLTKTVEKSNLQISELLRLFQDGLIIIDEKFEVQYKNEKANILIKNESDVFEDQLRLVKFQDGRLLFDVFHKIEITSNQSSPSLGITKINSSLYEWTISIIEWNGDLCFMIMVKDVTSVLKLERIASENAAKSALIRSVSHELRTPVYGIILLVESLIQDANANCKEKLLNIKTCAELLKFQISDILDYSDLSSNTFKLTKSSCDLTKCIKECVDLIVFQAKTKGIEIKTKIDEMIPKEFFTDSYRIQKTILNLLTNAIKYTNEGSIELCAVNIGNCINISIKDTGIGIPKERLNQIFDMFSDRISGMSGLGLHISNNILNYLGTSIRVSSIEGKGSLFSFDLAINESIPKYEFSREIDIPSEPDNDLMMPQFLLSIFDKQQEPKILIADDNDFNRMLLGSILTKHGIQYIEAINGKMAVKATLKYDKKKTPIKCIIMDCNMPVMDGWEAAKIINQNYTEGILKFLPVIIAHTAYSSSEDIQKCYDSGMISYILKPSSQDQILTVLRKYL